MKSDIVIDEGTVDDHIKKVVSIYSKHRNLEDKASYKGDKVARAKHKEGAKRASNLLAKMRSKQAAANADKPKPTEVHKDYSAAIAQDYKDQEAKRGIGHVRDSVELDGESINEISKELKDRYVQRASTAHSGYNMARRNTQGASKEYFARKEANTKKGIERALKTEESDVCPVCGQTPCNCTHIEEARMSAAVKLQRAFEREQQKSQSSRKRGEDLMVAIRKKLQDNQKSEKQPIGEEMTTKVHPDALHVSGPHKVEGQTKYKVHAVGKNFSSGIKVGEHLSDTELDDFSEMGGKIKHMKQVKEGRSLSEIMEEVKKRGRPRKNPEAAAPAKKKDDGDNDEDDYGPDTGPEADKHIQNQLKRAHDAHDLKGGADVHFENGKKHFVKSEHAHKVLTALEKLKPADRSTAAAHIYKSHENFQAVHSMLK